MTDVVLFHHAQGLTRGVRDLAERLCAAGHPTTLPDLYDGAIFDSLDAGVAHAQAVGFDTLLERGRKAVEGLPGELVYAGLSLGVLPAQLLAQTRPGAKGALLLHACVPPAELGGAWPDGVPVQVHAMDADTVLHEGGDLDAARELVASTEAAELFLYPGARHLFTDSSLPDHDPAAAALLEERVLAFLDRLR